MDLEKVRVYDLITGNVDSYDVDPSLIRLGDLLASYLEEGFEILDSKSLLVSTYRELEAYVEWMRQFSKDFKSLIAIVYMGYFNVLGIRK